MSPANDLWRALAGMAVGLVAGGLLFVWPGYRETSRINERLEALQAKVTRLPERTEEVARLKAEVDEAARTLQTDFRRIPESPDIADLVRRLSLRVDGLTVRDQTFSASPATKAVPGSEYPTQSMPLTIDMEATFDSVFALVRAAESMERLVRIRSVKLVCAEPDDQAGVPLLSASVGVEAIYEPPLVGEDP